MSNNNPSTCTFCGRKDIAYSGNCETKRMCNFIPDFLETEEAPASVVNSNF